MNEGASADGDKGAIAANSLQIGIQGERGSNSHLAALQAFPSADAAIVPCPTSVDVFERLADRSVERVVLPIENSLHGSVFEHYDLLLDYKPVIIGEIMLPIRHNVITAPGVPLADLRQVMSHPVALSQCRRWLRAHSAIEVVPSYDTAGSVKQLMQSGRRDRAGIAPALAAIEYGGEVLVANIEDHKENYTRFYILAKEAVQGACPKPDKASIAFRLEHQPGALLRALDSLSGAQLNLTKIESRPVPGRPWEYVFFVDVRYTSVDQLEFGLNGLRKGCSWVQEIGRYRGASL